MQKWGVYELKIGLQTDLHIGHRPLGFVARTLPYVPAHVPWYALSLALVKELEWPDTGDSFVKVEKFLEKALRFTPCYIFHPKHGVLTPFSWAQETVEREYLYSRYGVALDYSRRGAEENRLFEKEVITARNRGDYSRTLLQGYIFVKPIHDQGLVIEDGPNVNGISMTKLINLSTWGGEVSRGMGVLSHAELIPANEVYGCRDLDLDGTEPVLNWPSKKKGPFYLSYDPHRAEDMIGGSIRPVCGRRHHPELGPGLGFEPPFLSWMPGWQCSDDLRIQLGVKAASVVLN